MTFYRLTAPLYTASQAVKTGKPETENREGIVARMFRLWIENNLRVAQLRMLDR